MAVSARRSRPLQLTCSTGCGRLRGAQWEPCCTGYRSNTSLQWRVRVIINESRSFERIDNESGHENDDTLLSLENLIFGAEEVSKSQRAESSIKHKIEKSDNVFEYSTKKDCNNAFTSGDRDRDNNIDDSSDVYFRSDGSTSE